MKTLTHICEEADKALSFLGVTSGQLETVAKSWMDFNPKPIAYKISVKNNNVIIIVESDDKYDILRFFPVGGKWHTSADQTNRTKEEAIQYLLNRFE